MGQPGTTLGAVLVNLPMSADFGALAWTIPGAALTLPGLLILLIIGGQSAIATLFVPITKRVLKSGSDRERARAHPAR